MNRINYIIIALFVLILTSCNKPVKEDEPTVARRSVLMYVLANNNLNGYSKSNINELIANYSESDYDNCNLIIYYQSNGSNTPKLLKISNNKEVEIIKEYDDDHNPTDYRVMSSVIEEFKQMFPAESYGCIFWSHASAWLPKTFFGTATSSSNFSLYDSPEVPDISTDPMAQYVRQVEEFPMTKAFGQDGTKWMEMEELTSGLNDNEFDFIIFDCCYMSSIELAYSIRNKTKWILSSPNEVLANGMEYRTIARHLFAKSNDYKSILTNIAEDYYSRYTRATISILDVSKVEKFATDYKALIKRVPSLVGPATPRNVQNCDRYVNHVLFDIVHYISTISNGSETANIQKMIDEVVVFKKASPEFLTIKIDHFSGVSSYIPFESYNLVTPFYKELSWWNNVLKQE